MWCYKCGSRSTIVDSRISRSGNEVIRQRVCRSESCKHKWITKEVKVMDRTYIGGSSFEGNLKEWKAKLKELINGQ